MKILEIVALRAMQVWLVLLTSTVIVSLGYAIFQVITGNYHGTASREF